MKTSRVLNLKATNFFNEQYCVNINSFFTDHEPCSDTRSEF